jgi:pyruvyltransferase
MFGRPKVINKESKIIAVRGKLTLNTLKGSVDKESIKLGDGGLLVRDLCDDMCPDKKYKLGVIPHYIDVGYAKTNLDVLLSAEDVLFIDILADPMVVLQNIMSCEKIVSSSLHGLVAADSLSIPNRHVTFNGSKKIAGGGFKYRDYYSVFDVGGSDISPMDITAKTSLETIIGWTKDYHRGNIDQIIDEIRSTINAL